LTNLLNAIGKIKTTFKLMIMWTVLTWLLVPILSIKFGVIGAALGYALVSSSSVIAIFIAKKSVDFSLKESALRPGIAALLMFVVLTIVRRFLLVDFTSVWILIIAGMSLYVLLMYLLSGPSLVRDVKVSVKTLFSRK
jgi:O-antigen/teichoic acid export membrane protein